MSVIDEKCREVLEKTEWNAIVTWDNQEPHLVGAWGGDLRAIGIEADTLILPAGRYFKTEENLKKNPRIQLMIVSKDIQGARHQGQGYRIFGNGMIQTAGEKAEKAKAKFPSSRGALVINVAHVEALL